MGEFDERYDIIYEDRVALINSIIITSIITCISMLISNIDYKLTYGLMNIFFIITTFSIILITLLTKEIYKGKFFRLLIFTYVFLIFVSTIGFLNTENIKAGMFSYENLQSIETQIVIQLIYRILLSMPVIYIAKNQKVKSVVSIFIGGVSVVTVYLILSGQYYTQIYIIGLIQPVIVMVYLYLLKDYKFIDGKNINYFKISMILLLVNSMMQMQYLFIGGNTHIRISYTFVFAYLVLICGVINKLINDPYKILFASLYEENIKINKINKEIIKSNKNLEKSQINIRRKEKMFQLFLSEIPMSILIVNNMNNRIIFANNSFLKLFKLDTIKDVVNKKFDKIIHINEGVFSKERDIIYSGIAYVEGKRKYFEIETVDFNDKDDQKILLIYDSTEKRSMEGVKEKIRKELLEENIKREFLSNITHDLKTPINVIYSASQLEKILIENKNLEELNKYNFIAKHNCKSLISLTNNLIDSSRMNTNYMVPKLRRINLVEIVENNVVALVDYAKMRNIDLIFDTNREEIFCELDEEFINRIITNLLSNSIKFTGENGEIQVTVELEENNVRVEIKDNGVGMDKFFLKVAFERYTMQRDEGSRVTGTGIGLFVVRKFVELQGGKIKIESEVGKGTQIQMFFDVYDEIKEKEDEHFN